MVVLSETSITNRDAARSNALPGRLKSIVLGMRHTVSYAGLSSQALDVIRSVHRDQLQDADAIRDRLFAAARRFPHELDFLLCSHDQPEAPRLIKVTSDATYEGADYHWIGNAQSARALAALETPIQHPQNPPDFQSAEERVLTQRFFQYMEKSLDPNVGGAVVNCLCSPFGHCYQDHAGTHSWDRISTLDSTPPEVRAAEHRTGGTSYSYHVYSPATRGTGVVGFFLEQAGVGFIHCPLERDDPLRVKAADQSEFSAMLRGWPNGRVDEPPRDS